MNTAQLTHQAGLDWTGDDGIKRAIRIARFDNDTYGLWFLTWWDGDGKPPMETMVGMMPDTFDAMIRGCIEFRMTHERFAVDNAGPFNLNSATPSVRES